jgi:hypothetical protein
MFLLTARSLFTRLYKDIEFDLLLNEFKKQRYHLVLEFGSSVPYLTGYLARYAQNPIGLELFPSRISEPFDNINYYQ